MLEPPAADTETVMHRLLVLVACACSALVLASFAMFARDQLAGASAHQVAEINAPPPGSSQSATQPVHHAQPRRFIDGAASTLTSPFSSIVQSDNPWVKHALPTIFALLVYGVGIGYTARFTRGMS
ncbi:MAG TPA: hypothetical protein VG410_11480 [Solirubrobacteraceae bacterium]|jgi:hypothetical protein|nr:hypothetical protein [Solirubrobacteraceae bacterium]